MIITIDAIVRSPSRSHERKMDWKNQFQPFVNVTAPLRVFLFAATGRSCFVIARNAPLAIDFSVAAAVVVRVFAHSVASAAGAGSAVINISPNDEFHKRRPLQTTVGSAINDAVHILYYLLPLLTASPTIRTIFPFVRVAFFRSRDDGAMRA